MDFFLLNSAFCYLLDLHSGWVSSCRFYLFLLLPFFVYSITFLLHKLSLADCVSRNDIYFIFVVEDVRQSMHDSVCFDL